MPGKDLRELWLRRENWTVLYALYRCSDDPRLVVPIPNRDGVPKWWLGTTWNIAHRKTWLAMALSVVGFLLPVAIAYRLGVENGAILAGIVAATLAVGWRIAWFLASESRGDRT